MMNFAGWPVGSGQGRGVDAGVKFIIFLYEIHHFGLTLDWVRSVVTLECHCDAGMDGDYVRYESNGHRAPKRERVARVLPVRLLDAVCVVYTCRQLIDLSLIRRCLRCIYKLALDRSLSDCRYGRIMDADALWFNFRAWSGTSIDNVNPKMFALKCKIHRFEYIIHHCFTSNSSFLMEMSSFVPGSPPASLASSPSATTRSRTVCSTPGPIPIVYIHAGD